MSGISGIFVTPFDQEGTIAPSRLFPIIERAIAAGVHISVVNGNTSEFYALTVNEACQMVREVSELVAGRAPLLGGVGRAIPDAIEIAKASVKAGVSGLLIHQTPDPFVAPRGFVDYVQRVAEAADGTPLVLYLRNDAIGTSTVARLCEIENVIGIKWATPNVLKLSEAIETCPQHIVWVAGLAEIWAPPLYAVGARGFTSGLVNVWPERSVEIHSALQNCDFAEAQRLITGMKTFEVIRSEEMNGTNVTGVKAALLELGLDCGTTRPPSAWPLSSQQHGQLVQFLSDAGLLAASGGHGSGEYEQ